MLPASEVSLQGTYDVAQHRRHRFCGAGGGAMVQVGINTRASEAVIWPVRSISTLRIPQALGE